MLSPRFARARYRRRGARGRESPSWGVSFPGVKITREWRSPDKGELDRDPAYVRATLNGVGHPIGEPAYGHTGQAPRDGPTEGWKRHSKSPVATPAASPILAPLIDAPTASPTADAAATSGQP